MVPPDHLVTFKKLAISLIWLAASARSTLCLFIFYVRLEDAMLNALNTSEREMKMLKFCCHQFRAC